MIFIFLLVMSDSRALFLDVSLPLAVPVPLALHSLSAHQHSLRELQLCNPRHERLFGPMAEFNTPARNEPNDPIGFNNTEVKLMFFNISSMASTYDPAESIATPLLESDLDDEQIQVMPASPLYLLERSMCRPTSSLSLLWPKYCSKNAEHNLAIVQVVNFRDRSSPIVWKLIIRTMNTKRHEENKPDIMKNWHEKLITEELRCRKWKEFRKWELTNSPGTT